MECPERHIPGRTTTHDLLFSQPHDPNTVVVAFQATNAGSSLIQGNRLGNDIRPSSHLTSEPALQYEKPSLQREWP